VSFEEFYARVYLPRHADRACRLLHLIGALLVVPCLAAVVWLGAAVSDYAWWLLPLVPVPTYVLAWLGHVVAGNKPTAFEHPWWSFLGYWKMVGSMLAGDLWGSRTPAGRAS